MVGNWTMHSQNALIWMKDQCAHNFSWPEIYLYAHIFSFIKIHISFTAMKAYIQSTFNFPNNTLKFDIKLPFDKSLNNIKFSLINQIYKFLNYKKEYYRRILWIWMIKVIQKRRLHKSHYVRAKIITLGVFIVLGWVDYFLNAAYAFSKFW